MGREGRIRKIDNAQQDLNKMFELFIAEKQRNGRSPDTMLEDTLIVFASDHGDMYIRDGISLSKGFAIEMSKLDC